MRRFWSELKDEFKRTAWMYLLMLLIGYGMGKIYTWDSIISDCKVLGTFRIANTAFHCKILAP